MHNGRRCEYNTFSRRQGPYTDSRLSDQKFRYFIDMAFDHRFSHVVPLFRGNNGMNGNFMYSKQIETNVYERGLIVLKKNHIYTLVITISTIIKLNRFRLKRLYIIVQHYKVHCQQPVRNGWNSIPNPCDSNAQSLAKFWVVDVAECVDHGWE